MRLRRSDLSAPGLIRRRRGRGFSYHHADGTPADADEIDRIRALAIPPAWREVWICPWRNGHIQAVGIDDDGRRQYRYHDDWRRQRDREKYDRVLRLAPELPRFRAAVADDLGTKGLPRHRVLAVGLRMLDHGVFRTGGDEYLERNGTHGAVTLLREQVRTRDGRVSFAYRAKGGKDQVLTLADRPLAGAVAALRRARTGSDRLLVYRDTGGWHEVHPEDINERFRELAGDEFTVKDLRTWNATVLAAAALAGRPTPTSRRSAARTETAVLREVAEHLGNTPAVARKSYVDPRLFDLFEHGTTITEALRDIDTANLGDAGTRIAVERAVTDLLT